MHESKTYILLIDDDDDDLEMYSSELGKKGIKVKPFNCSVRALFYLTLVAGISELPAFIIMDFNMPKKNGLQVLQAIKDNKDTKNIPVVIYSTNMSSNLKTKLLNAGAVDCFSKPWNYDAFIHQIGTFQQLTSSLTINRLT